MAWSACSTQETYFDSQSRSTHPPENVLISPSQDWKAVRTNHWFILRHWLLVDESVKISKIRHGRDEWRPCLFLCRSSNGWHQGFSTTRVNSLFNQSFLEPLYKILGSWPQHHAKSLALAAGQVPMRSKWLQIGKLGKKIKGPDNPTCEVLCRPAWYAFGKRWVVWDEWCELVVWDEGCGIEWCEMSGVRWVVWDGLCVRWVVCEMSGVRWVVWDGWCEMSCVSCKWDEWYEMRGLRWVVWISGAGWVVWDELCEMSGVN